MRTTNTKNEKSTSSVLGLNFNAKHVIWNNKRHHSHLTQFKFR